jgi:hypothetical protein
MSYNVQRFATRRQHERSSAMLRSNVINSVTFLHSLGAVYTGAREARGGANRIVIRCRAAPISPHAQ